MPKSRIRTARDAGGGRVELASELTLDDAQPAPAQRRPAYDHDVQAGVAAAQPLEALADQPARPVARDGVAEPAADGHPEPRPAEAVRVHEQQEQASGRTPAPLEDGAKLGLAPQALPWAQTGCRPHQSPTLARRDALAPLLAAPLQDEAPALGPHAHEKAVGAPPASVVRLEGALHGFACLSL